MISVIIPLYNKEKYIKRSIESVLNQTFRDFEILVVDDGSTDNSYEVIKTINDERIRLFHQKNAGVSAARNKGIHEAKYNLIAFLDADDIWKPGYLQAQYDLYMKYPDCCIFACNYQFRNSSGQVTNTIINNLPFKTIDGIIDKYFVVASSSNPPICSSSVMIKKCAINEISGFPIGIKSGEDLITWAKLCIRYKTAYNRTPLAIFINDSQLFNQDQIQRMPETNDYVGNELKKLLKEYPKTPGLKAYIALWHKMRARIYLDKDLKSLALRECIKSIKYHISIKIIAFIVLCFCPHSISKYILNKK